MTFAALEQIKGLDGVTMHPGLADHHQAKFEVECDIPLPKMHLETLQVSNGIEVYAGYVRLFGLYSKNVVDAVTWNFLQNWKFAWKDRCIDFWCFAETAWGDQYAYLITDLLKQESERVFFLDALSMTAKLMFSSFEEFLEKEFLRQASNPYDITIRQARARFGSLRSDLHLTYVPSILLGGRDDVACAQMQDARSAMICNGDIATQLDAATAGRSVVAVQTYEDELGRMRLRLTWA